VDDKPRELRRPWLYGDPLVRRVFKPVVMMRLLAEATAVYWRTRGWPPDGDGEARARSRLEHPERERSE